MTLLADSDGPDQTARMRGLIWAFAVRIILCPKTHFRMAHYGVLFIQTSCSLVSVFMLWLRSQKAHDVVKKSLQLTSMQRYDLASLLIQ